MAYQTKHELTADQRAVLTEQMVGELHERLVGNGQPGPEEIENIHSRIKATNDRVTDVERWQERANGASDPKDTTEERPRLMLLGIILSHLRAAWGHLTLL